MIKNYYLALSLIATACQMQAMDFLSRLKQTVYGPNITQQGVSSASQIGLPEPYNQNVQQQPAALDNNNCCRACSSADKSYFNRFFRHTPLEQQYSKLKDLIRQGDTNDPKVLLQIRALLCGIYPFSLNQTSYGTRSITGVWVCIETYDKAYELMKLAVQHDAKNVIRLLYNHMSYGTITKKNLRNGMGQKYVTCFPSDLEVLLSSIKDHKDPQGMTELLLNYRTTQEALDETSTQMYAACSKEGLRSGQINYCTYLRQALMLYQAKINRETRKQCQEALTGQDIYHWRFIRNLDRAVERQKKSLN